MKLVRDNYKSDQGFTLSSVEDRLSHVVLLVNKIREETGELLDSGGPEQAKIEAGDLIEAILAYCQIQWEISEDQILATRKEKTGRLGGFIKGIVWTEG